KGKAIYLSVLLIVTLSASLGAQNPPQSFREAVILYEQGAYGKARAIFDELGDPLSQAWSILCAVKVNSSDYQDLIDAYISSNPDCVLVPQLYFASAVNDFAAGDYEHAYLELNRAGGQESLPEKDRAEYLFMRGYSAYKIGNMGTAVRDFYAVQGRPWSVYTAPSRYLLGYIAYTGKDFAIARSWFTLSGSDERFKDLSDYYVMECRFMEKDYDYVIENAPAMLDTIPEGRQPRLARMLSESYLVRGSNAKALEYFQRENLQKSPESPADLFHAGSVYYAMEDYRNAAANFSRIPDRSDSLGQVANYNLAYSYIRTGDKVSAAQAFKDASAASFRPDLQEDAAFNYAKLSFDLNGDTAPFIDYMNVYTAEKRGEQIYNYMAIAALNNRDYAEAIENYSRIEELDEAQKGNYVKANYLRGSQLVAGGSWSDAVPFLKAACFWYPKNDRFNQLSRYWLAEAQFNSGSYKDAEQTWEELYNTSALRGMQEGALLPYNLGYAYYGERKYEAAARWFDIYVASQDPFCREDALTRRADCDFARHDYKSAVKAYRKVRSEFSSPDKIYPYYQEALALGLSGDKKGKVEVLREVLKASSDAPLFSETMYELGRAQMENGDYANAIRSFETLRSRTSDATFAARALIGKGMAFRNLGQYETALNEYMQVVDLMPDSEYSEEALLAINSIYQTTGEPEKYIEYVEKNGLSIGKTTAEKEAVYFNTAEQIYIAGNYNQAVSYLRKYLSDYPDGTRRGDATFYLADSYRRLGEKEKAVECFAAVDKYLKEGSFAESAALSYANLSYELERFQDAYAGYVRLGEMAMMPENVSAARLGRLRSASGAKMWNEVIAAADEIAASDYPGSIRRESEFAKAKALLATSRREEAYAIYGKLAGLTSTPEGAESAWMTVQDLYDRGRYSEAENKVYEYSATFGSQSYWLARCYITLADVFLAQGKDAQAKATLESIRDGYTPADEGDDIAKLVSERLSKLVI
ncbi:MAG: tetratricopeptide repeat protein, partial [Bacteroidales bacterium]|nr:tetratricopeptide repeat protein [Bacteroidales bacterium]